VDKRTVDFSSLYAGFSMKYLGRNVATEDGTEEARIAEAENALQLRLPVALRQYYRLLGQADALNTIHNFFHHVEDLRIEDGCLIFMDENQSAVSWGVRLSDMHEEDPIVWQRNNTRLVEWYSEEKPFSALMESMFDWYQKEGLCGGT
jgi:hypothetical protein